MSVYGTRLYGKVDRVAGVGCVATKFFHVNYLPLVPLGSFAVLDGTDDTYAFTGQPVRWNLGSVLLGYLRGWSGAAALGFGLAGVLEALVLLHGPGHPPFPFWWLIVSFLAMFIVFLVFLYGSTRWWLSAWLLFGAFTAGFLYEHPPTLALGLGPRASQAAALALLASNSAFLFYSLMRPFGRAHDEQARRLGERLGVPPEVVEAAQRGEKVEWKRSRETGALVWSIGEQAEAAFSDPAFRGAGSPCHSVPSGDRQPTGIS